VEGLPAQRCRRQPAHVHIARPGCWIAVRQRSDRFDHAGVVDQDVGPSEPPNGGTAQSFQEFAALRSRLLQAIRDEAANGQTPALMANAAVALGDG
jgi:hypothetical protein